MSPNSDNIVEIQNVHFSRNSKVIFDNVSISVRRGKITAVMGPSGSGKTTLLRLIGGQLIPDAGTVFAFGEDVPELSREKLYKIRRHMGMLFQSGALFSDISVFENVAFPLREHTRLPESMIRDLVLMKLQAVGLRGARALMPSELSGGMARRVALARALAMDPSLIMFDEPFAGQDPITMGVLVKLIRLLNDALKMTTVIVSHDVQETVSIADYIYVIADGRVVGEGSPESLVRDGTDWVKQFMEGLPDGPVPFHYPASPYANDLWETHT
jgi:phospholipid/cholesterol/gamma-HCH transport system ATP-binding protein